VLVIGQLARRTWWVLPRVLESEAGATLRSSPGSHGRRWAQPSRSRGKFRLSRLCRSTSSGKILTIQTNPHSAEALLVDAIVVWGDVDAITRRVMEHYDAGADHVCIQVFDVDPHGLPMRQWRELANAFT
jgi:hypothetical protein